MSDQKLTNQMVQGEIYSATVALRVSHAGRPLKPGVGCLNGKTLNFYAEWECDPDESYPGEWAMVPADDTCIRALHDAGIAWIASGDLSNVSANAENTL